MDERVLAERLITYDTSTSDGLRAAVGFVKGWLEARDVPVTGREFGGLPVVLADIGPATGPCVILHGHVDVVPAHADQFSPRIEGDRLIGRGAYDMKGGLAAMMCAVHDVAQNAKVRVRFICVPDEESDNLDFRCTDALVQEGLRADFAITGEPTDLHIGVQAKGVLAVRVEVGGTAAHGSTPWLGDNAILKAYDVFRRIETLRFSRESSDLFDRPSINVARILGGDAFNKVPDRCTMDVDIRYLPTQDPGEILADIRALEDVQIVKTFQRAPAKVSRANPYVRALREAVSNSLDDEALSIGRDGASDAISFLEAGIPAVEFGPTGGGHHGPEEWVSIDSLARYRQALRDFVTDLPDWLASEAAGTGERPPLRAVDGGLGVMSVWEGESSSGGLTWGMWKRFALGGVLVVLLSATAVASGVLLQVHETIAVFQKESTPIPGIKNELDKVEPGGPQTILVLGSDGRYGDGKGVPVRSDTMIIVRLDPDKNATAVMSIPRDLKVEIPGRGTGKINTAFALGGPRLSVRTVKLLLGLPISHVVNVNFNGFQRAVNRLGCVYVDIDRRYFNDRGGPGGYATIDVKPGYQKMCGKDSLDYVRYRHTDDDFVRANRQQDFLRQAKDQVGLGKVFGDRNELLKIFGRYTQTDIARDNDAAILRLIKLAYDSTKNPIHEVKFRAAQSSDPEYLEITRENLQTTVDEFIDVGLGASLEATKSDEQQERKKPKLIKTRKTLAKGLVLRREAGENHVLTIATKLKSLPVYFPKAIIARGGYQRESPRLYDIYDRNKNKYRAYRLVLSEGDNGQFYGVQGMTWKAPPILDNPTDEVRMRKRTYKRYFDGRKIRLIAWETKKAVYWVSNTLSKELTNQQMMDIARSLQRIGQ